jgi:predicted transcriptional regulator
MRLLLSVVLLAVVMSSPALVAASPVTGTNLRTQDERLTQLVRAGMARSSTLRALVDRIEASRVIVYVAINPLMKPNLSGMLTWMTQAGGYRYLRASISNDLTQDQMIATIAHELQHAVEVIEDEAVHDENSLVALYRRIGQQRGHSSPSRWETDAAQQTGFVVRKELASAPMPTVVRSGAPGRS